MRINHILNHRQMQFFEKPIQIIYLHGKKIDLELFEINTNKQRILLILFAFPLT